MEKIQVKTAVFALKKNGIIIYPTETSYGIGCKISDITSVKRIRKIKEDRKKPFSIIVSTKEMAKEYSEIDSEAEKLIDAFMPGPLTLIVPAKEKILLEVSEKAIALRISSNQIANTIVKEINEPLISTSANLTGKKPIYSFSKAVKVFGKKVDFIVNAGILPKNKPSTIYGVKEKKIIRKGKITEKQIKKALGQQS
jgi:tRNA threonylcarbamoyl adenosine modification protein (Sua5/YciO/YrdC/YwlC family)